MPNNEEQKAIDFDSQESFEFAFDIAIAPDFKVVLDEKVSVPYYEIEVDDKMIENAVKSYTRRFGSYEDAEAATESDVIKGNLVEMRTKTKEKEDGISVEEAVLCPKYMKAEDQKKLFEGLKVGESVSFNPKKAYENHRLTNPRFLKSYEVLLKKGAEIHQKTDNMHFFEFSIEEFSAAGYKIENVSLDLHNSGFEGNIMTEYEKRFTDLGQPIYRLEAKIP